MSLLRRPSVSSRPFVNDWAKALFPNLDAHQALFFPIPVAFLFGFSLVVLFLAFCQSDFDFDSAFLKVQIQRHQSVSGAFNQPYQFADLLGVQEKFACPDRIGMNVGRRFSERRNVHAKDEDFTITDDDVGLFDIRSAGSNGLDLPAQQGNACLELFFDEVVVKRLFVGDDAHVA